MLSLTKIITLVGILTIVWYGFRLIGKIQRQRRDALRRHGGAEASRRPPDGRRSPAMDTQDMVKCPVCGVYNAAGAGKCGTPGCPG